MQDGVGKGDCRLPVVFRMPEKNGLVQQQGFRRHDRQANSRRAVLSRLQHRDLRVLHLVLVSQSRLDLKTAGWYDGRCVWPGRFFYVYLRSVMGVPYRIAFRIPIYRGRWRGVILHRLGR